MLDKASSRRWIVVGALALVAVTLVAYWPSLFNGYIWDDPAHVTENKMLTAPNGLWQMWFNPGATQQYYPLVFTLFRAQYDLWALNPLGYHTVNLLAQIAVALLLWRVLWKLQLPGSFLVALLFAIHPIQVETVAWITEQKNLFSALFELVALLSYLRFANWNQAAEAPLRPPVPAGGPERAAASGARWPWALLTMVLFAAALACKTTAASLPVIILLLHYLRGRRVTWAQGALLVPLFAVAFAAGLFTAWVEHYYIRAQGPAFAFTPAERLLVAGRAAWFYPLRILAPTQLAFFYTRWDVDPSVWWQWLFPAGVVLLVVILFALRQRIGRGPLVAALAYGAIIFPALGFFNVYPFRFSLVADHFQYMAFVAVVALLVAGIVKLAGRLEPGDRRWAQLAVVPVVGVLAVLTWQQTHIYKDSETLWRDTVAKTPTAYAAMENLGHALIVKARQTDDLTARMAFETEALNWYGQVLAHDPTNSRLRDTLGRIYITGGRTYKLPLRSVAGQPEIDEAALQAAARAKTADFLKGVELLEQAEALDPEYGPTHSALAQAYHELGRLDEAYKEAQRAVGCMPERADYVAYALQVARESGRKEAAVAWASQLAVMLPADPAAAAALARAQLAVRNFPAAERAYQQALELAPDDPQLRFDLAQVYAALRRYADAAGQLRLVVQRAPDSSRAWAALAELLCGLDDPALTDLPAAVAAADQAIAHNAGKDPKIHDMAGLVYYHAGRYDAALAQARQAHDLARAAGQAQYAAEIEQRMLQYTQARDQALALPTGLR